MWARTGAGTQHLIRTRWRTGREVGHTDRRADAAVTTFALVHGAFHGAWCWDLVRAELESRGHRTIAMDLPCDDPEAGNVRYAEVVTGAINDVGDDVILVGHSLAG